MLPCACIDHAEGICEAVKDNRVGQIVHSDIIEVMSYLPSDASDAQRIT